MTLRTDRQSAPIDFGLFLNVLEFVFGSGDGAVTYGVSKTVTD